MNPNGLETSYRFEYGETTAYGSEAPTSAQSAGDGSEDIEVETGLKGLHPATTYHYRVVATNSDGATYGEDRTFTTRALAPTFDSSFGSHGSGEGQLDEPLGIAVASSGDLWVADANNHRIDEFSPAGQLLRQVGGEGTGAGQFGSESPYAVAIGPEGDVWAADTSNNRIEQFGPEGEFVKAFGEGQIHDPYGLAFDSAGHLWVMSTGNSRMVEFSREGALLSQPSVGGGPYYDIAVDSEDDLWVVGAHQVKKLNPKGEVLLAFGSEGAGNGQLDVATGIAVDSEDDIWVADSGNDRIQEFNPQGEYLAQFGSEGAGEGQLDFPRKVAFDSEGSLWVVDSYNDRIQRWSYGPSAVTGTASAIGTRRATLGGTVNPHDRETTYQFEYGKTTSYGGKAPSSPQDIGADATDHDLSRTIKGLARATTYHYRVVATNSDGATYGEDRTFTTRALAPTFDSSFGSHGSGEGQLDEPLGIAVASSGDLWVADANNHRIDEFSPAGQLLRQVGGEGTGAGQFGSESPYAVAIGPEGDVWAADTSNNRIEQFGPEGEFVKAFGEGQIHDPYGLAFDSAGHLWVMSTGNSRMVEFSREGALLSQPSVGGGPYYDIAVDSEDDLWVVGAHQVKKLNPKGEVLLAFGSEGAGNGQLDVATGIAVDSEDDVWVADSGNDRIQEFNPQGEYLAQFGSEGAGEGQLDFPRKVAFDSEGSLWVVDSYNDRIQRWSYGPSAVTLPATYVQPSQVTLDGMVNPNGEAGTTYQFEYGQTTAYGSVIPSQPRKLGPGSRDDYVDETLAELPLGATYHYRVVASNETGTTYGADEIATTALPLSWAECTERAGGRFESSECSEESSPGAWEPVRLRGSGESVNATGGPFALTAKIAGASSTIECETEVSGVKLKNPENGGYSFGVNGAGGGVGIGSAVLGFSACQEEGSTLEACEVIPSAGRGVAFQLLRLEGEPGLALSPEEGTTLAVFTLSGSECPSPGTELSLTGTAYGLYSNAASQIEFTGETTARDLQLSGADAVATGTVGLRTSADGYVQVLTALPKALTKPAAEVKRTGATFGGTVTPESLDTHYRFEYGTTTAYGHSAPAEAADAGEGLSTIDVSQPVSGLQEGTGYHYRLVATNEAGASYGADKTFTTTTLPRRWAACTEQQGGRYPSGECATEGSPGGWEPVRLPEGEAVAVSATGGAIAVASKVAGAKMTLNCETEVGNATLENPKGAGSGSAELGFGGCKIESGSYKACEVAASEPGAVGFQLFWLEGETGVTLWPEEGTTLAVFTLSGSECPLPPTELSLTGTAYGLYSNPDSQIEFSTATTASGLKLNGIKATASGAIGLRASGGGYVEAVPGLPAAVTKAVSEVGSEGATLSGTVTPESLDTHYRFEYGTTTAYGHSAPAEAADAGEGLSTIDVSQPVSGLQEGTGYHYRLVATNEAGASYGADKTFTTTTLPRRWAACTEQQGGRYPSGECATEGSPGGWEPVRLPEGEAVAVSATGGAIAVASKVAGAKMTLNCETEVGNATLENPKGAGSGSAELGFGGCKIESGSYKACEVAASEPGAVGFQLYWLGGETGVTLWPEEGTTLAVFTLSGSECPLPPTELSLTGTAYGLYSNAASQVEFSTATTASGLKLNGIKATASGAIGLRASGGGYVEAGAF